MPYINTIDINGEIYNLGNLTDGDHVVDLPVLDNDDIFLLRGDVINNLVGYQQNQPLSANQGRVLNEKCVDLNKRLSELKENSETTDKDINDEIVQLKQDMDTNDASTLSSAKTYADGLKGQSDTKDSELDGKITTLRSDMSSNDSATLTSANSYTDTKCGETLTSANKHTDDSCNAINTTVAALQKTVQDNKSSADSGTSDLRQYVNETFIEKTKIADNLTTNSSEQVLSAKQGKLLDEKKFNSAGGTITGDVTVNADITIGDNTHGVTVSKVPSADSDVANKKYVDDKISGYSIADGSITTAMIADGAITKAKLGTDIALDSSEIGATTEGWTYIKMSNGVAIAWGSFTKSAGVGSSGEFSETYPTGLFIEAPVCTPFLYTNGQDVIQYSKNAGDKDNTPKIGVCLLSSILEPDTSEALGDIKIDYMAIGKYK